MQHTVLGTFPFPQFKGRSDENADPYRTSEAAWTALVVWLLSWSYSEYLWGFICKHDGLVWVLLFFYCGGFFLLFCGAHLESQHWKGRGRQIPGLKLTDFCLCLLRVAEKACSTPATGRKGCYRNKSNSMYSENLEVNQNLELNSTLPHQ